MNPEPVPTGSRILPSIAGAIPELRGVHTLPAIGMLTDGLSTNPAPASTTTPTRPVVGGGESPPTSAPTVTGHTLTSTHLNTGPDNGLASSTPSNRLAAATTMAAPAPQTPRGVRCCKCRLPFETDYALPEHMVRKHGRVAIPKMRSG